MSEVESAKQCRSAGQTSWNTSKVKSAKHQSSPAAANSCLELEVARKFRTEMRKCTRAAKTWQEFSVDSDLLAESATTASVKSEKSPAKVEQKCGNFSGQSSQENKNYLLVRTEMTTLVIPVDGAVGHIVSEQEAAKLLCSQPVSSSSLCAAEFVMDTVQCMQHARRWSKAAPIRLPDQATSLCLLNHRTRQHQQLVEVCV